MAAHVDAWPASPEELVEGAALPSGRVISFCLFGGKAIYTEGAIQNAHLARALFPGWACVYYLGDGVPSTTVEALINAGAIVRRCAGLFGGTRLQMLRFLPAGEPGVACVIVRDADSRLNLRDAAAVADWLASGKQFHLLHEAPHDPAGGILGGMWGVRAVDVNAPPLPGLYETMAAFAAGHSTDRYGDDMVFLETDIRPLCGAATLCHHSAAARGGRLAADVPPLPFPATAYRGFVGQPVNCPGRCGWEAFRTEGCFHVAASAVVAPEVAARIRHQPDAVASVAAFLGGL